MTTIEDRLAGLDVDFPQLVDGEWIVPGGETFACVDPYTEREWGRVPVADESVVDRAVRAARRAFDETDWPRTPAPMRAAMLRRLADLIGDHKEELAQRQSRENGKLIGEMRGGIDVVVGDCHFFAGLAETTHGFTMPPGLPNFTTYTVRDPVGVVAAITPWNTPLGILGWKLFPALAAGNTIVVKPSEITPTSTLLLAELVEEAGFPPGVVNVITGPGSPTGRALVAHPGVDKIAFTGSTTTGLAIARTAAERNARVSLELGGKSPTIIFDDADVSNAVHGVMAGIFAATGQSCVAGSRVLVQEGVHDEVASLLSERARQIRLGDPLDTASQMGPLASRPQLDKVVSYLELGAEEAEVVTGGTRADRTGFFVEPTVFAGVTNSARIASEEIFGPVATLIRFRDEEDALRIANDTRYGLAAGVWTENLRRAHRMISRLRAGTVWVNNYRVMGHGMPFGGFKQSGTGRELGVEALHAYTEVKSVWIDTGNEIQFPYG